MLERKATLYRNAYKGEGGAYRMYGKEERCVQGFGGETCGERNHLEDLIKMDLK